MAEPASKNLISSSTPNQSDDLLKETLDKHSHLNLSGRVTFDRLKPMKDAGTYGNVYIGIYDSPERGKVMVAIKCLRHLNSDTAKIAAKEIYIWSKLDHPNLLRFLGFILEDGNIPSLVSDWMENGSVLEYVKSHPECDVIRLILGIAEGLEYLHENNIVHSDIKSDSILVSPSGDAVICDFGISRAMNATQVALGGNTTMPGGPGGTVRWMAYELLAETDKYTKYVELSKGRLYFKAGLEDNWRASPPKHTKESDVWAFGMTVYELLAKERPYAHITIEMQVVISVMRRQLPKSPASFDTWPKKKKEAWGICASCWTVDPVQRITMADIVKELKAMKHSILDVDNVLTEMKHLDLTRFITYDRTNTFTSGTYSDMYAGKYYPEGVAGTRASQLVSVKRYRLNAIGPQDNPQAQLVNELQVCSPLKHSNILQFLGYIREQDGSLSLVSEWMGDKTLLRFIRGNYGRNRLRTISGIAEGLAYLHDKDVIHRDIKSESIIMTGSGDAIICGLELAHKIGSVVPDDRESADPDTPIGSIRWMAIELIANPEGGYALHSKASDVWAFAMTVYETLAETTPYSRIPRDVQVIIRIVQGELPAKPQSHEVWPPYKEALWKLCESCWNKNPEKRPSMKAVIASLEKIRIQADKVQDRYSGDLLKPPANKAQE